jgi:transposase-like protein
MVAPYLRTAHPTGGCRPASWNQRVPTSFIPDTNMVESVNYQMRKASKTRGHFPDDDSALKLLRLIAQGWSEALNAFAIHFPNRLNIC